MQRSSSGGQTSELLGIVYASGQSRYDFEDSQPRLGMNYYRLRIMDVDGQFTYSPLVSVKVTGSGLASVLAYPNPNTGRLKLEFSLGEDAIVDIRILDILGKALIKNQFSGTLGSNRTLLNLTPLDAGIYFLQVSKTGSRPVLKKIVKQ